MRIPEVRNDASKPQLARVSHVYFEHPDLEVFGQFAEHWGFVEAKREQGKIWFRGYGVNPYVYVASKSRDGNPRFGGVAFVAKSEEDFHKATLLPGGILENLADSPGGGKMITCKYHPRRITAGLVLECHLDRGRDLRREDQALIGND
ncbi:hypothetical protein F4808DRAFT_50408 [Astrocystis sublimbata]|nr:hypothetical protein F4808DRAFT_50408 [Astrocystis sublimbata]